jgi:hypothetical protein
MNTAACPAELPPPTTKTRPPQPGHLGRDEDLRAEADGLLAGAQRQIRAGQPDREAQVVLDPAGGARLAPGGVALQDEGREPLRRPVDPRRQPGRPCADHDQVVGGAFGAHLEADPLGDRVQVGGDEDLTVVGHQDR